MSSPSKSRWRPLADGATVGAAASLVGYLVTWILAGTAATRLTVGGPFGGALADWKAVLWTFYDAHFVGVRTPQVFGPGGDRWGGGELVDVVGLLGVEYVYTVPVLVLLLAGAVVARRGDATTPREGARAGGTVAVGYLAAVVLGLFAASESGVAPDPFRALVVAGVVYPVIFGALGGLAVGYLDERRTDRSSETPSR